MTTIENIPLFRTIAPVAVADVAAKTPATPATDDGLVTIVETLGPVVTGATLQLSTVRKIMPLIRAANLHHGIDCTAKSVRAWSHFGQNEWTVTNAAVVLERARVALMTAAIRAPGDSLFGAMLFADQCLSEVTT